MKKVMLMLAAAAIAVGAQGVQFRWSFGDSLVKGYTGSGWDSAGFSGTVYFIDSSDLSRQAFLNAIVSAADDTAFATTVGSYSRYSTSASNGSVTRLDQTDPVKLDGSTAYSTTDGSAAFYAVIKDGDNYWISSEMLKAINATSRTTFSFDPATAASGTVAEYNFGDTAGTVGSGWYSVTAGSVPPIIPEPTSGLLMLVGLGALALRRRRA